MEKGVLQLIRFADGLSPAHFREERPVALNFSVLSDFDFLPCTPLAGRAGHSGSLSRSYSIQLASGPGASGKLPVFHNLFFPEIIYNNEPGKISWSLRHQGEAICSGKVVAGHPYRFDWDLIDGTTGNGTPLPTAYFPKNRALENDIRCRLEELGKHFFTIEMDVSTLLPGAREYELVFEFPSFSPQRSAADVQFLFNVVPVVDIIRSYEFFDGIKNGFNLKMLSKVKPGEFLGIATAWLEADDTKRITVMTDAEVEKGTPAASSYQLLPMTDSPGVGTMPDRRPQVVINNRDISGPSTAYIGYLQHTGDANPGSKELLQGGNPVKYEWVSIGLAMQQKVNATVISSRYDYFCAAREFFGHHNISNVSVHHRRDFNDQSVWTGCIEVEVETNTGYSLNYPEWAHFIFLCKNRCLDKDIDMNFHVRQRKN